MAGQVRAEQLRARLAPYWAAEERVFQTYWGWSQRTRETDRRWLALQCWKEIWGSGVARTREGLFLGAARELIDVFPRIDVEQGRRDVLVAIENLRDEFAHYCAFADVHDALAEPSEARLAPRDLVGWEEDRLLAELRFAHKREHPALGARAARITEGGAGALYRSGMQLVAGGPHARANRLISAACARVFEDEQSHIADGWLGLDDGALSDAEWRRLEAMTTEQAQLRIAMRNAQFSYPLQGEALAAARVGRLHPAPGA